MQSYANRRAAVKALVLITGLAAAGIVQAQAWPTQPIRLVVPYPPAGATDVVARLVAERITSGNGWNVVVDNKPGAGGNIGMDAVAKAKPDGYTVGMGQTSNLAINPTLYPKMPYDALKAFTPIAFVAQQPVVLVVNASSPYKTLADLVKAAKAKPGALTMASAANGTVGHLAGELLSKRAGYQATHVPYKGAAPAINDLIANLTDFMLPTPQAALPQIKSGKLRALAVTSTKRLPILGDVPTVAEAGYPGFEAVDWKVLVGPAGMPADVVKTMHGAVEAALAKPETGAKLQAEGSAPMTGTPQQLAQFLKTEHARWGDVVRSAGVKPE
ncbi:Bug family tripartite tricarboxylate transporter substrate binding protein [Azohydromonas lata]|uniref:Bug family tripartite tricarboxylate transporter substrate binding protein n=1 Tax=Azohydromonas lata TaxID=45677 RepID=UPI0008344F38|nr:tripartite tricarboxylate transporter substrate binding protein [Azohydromonas lata]